MRIEVSQDTFGYLVKLSGTSAEFGPALESFKNWIPAACRHYIGERKQWRVEKRSEDYLRFWLNEMNSAGAQIVDLKAQEPKRSVRIETDGNEARARLLLRAAHKELLIRPDAPAILAEAAYAVLKSQTTNELERASLDGAIETIRRGGRTLEESDAA